MTEEVAIMLQKATKSRIDMLSSEADVDPDPDTGRFLEIRPHRFSGLSLLLSINAMYNPSRLEARDRLSVASVERGIGLRPLKADEKDLTVHEALLQLEPKESHRPAGVEMTQDHEDMGVAWGGWKQYSY